MCYACIDEIVSLHLFVLSYALNSFHPEEIWAHYDSQGFPIHQVASVQGLFIKPFHTNCYRGYIVLPPHV